MNAYLERRINEQNEDLKTKKVREDLTLSLTDKAYRNLKLLAYKAGFESAGELLSSFVGDLTDWGGSNGTDERDCADRWYERAFGSCEYESNFRHFLYELGYDLDDMSFMLEEEDYFEDAYENYIDFNYGKENQSKEKCIALLKEIVEKGKNL
ncbi:hypothetical protein [Desulfitobacterium hafniense]|uniref:hypothetical protein n=1 Tax=Desulfitobacterium hafniense TaxID=49338 RepID=UPI000373BEA1|nr:hypothetical protein [Desulfitobacterium hafniense]